MSAPTLTLPRHAAPPPAFAPQAQLGLAHSYSRSKVKCRRTVAKRGHGRRRPAQPPASLPHASPPLPPPRFDVNRADKHIIQSIAILDTLDKDINTFAMRVREWNAQAG